MNDPLSWFYTAFYTILLKLTVKNGLFLCVCPVYGNLALWIYLHVFKVFICRHARQPNISYIQPGIFTQQRQGQIISQHALTLALVLTRVQN